LSFTLLVTSIGGEFGPQLIQYAKKSTRHDIKIVGTDVSKNAIGRHFCDYFEQVPFGTERSYVSSILEIIERYKVDLILPRSDEEALALSRKKTLVEDSGAKLACSDYETLGIMSNKATCYKHLTEMGIHVPSWKMVTSIEELIEVLESDLKVKGDLVVKPASERGGRGIFIISDALSGEKPCHGERELHMDLLTFKDRYSRTGAISLPLLIMERLKDPVYDIDMLAWHGKPIRLIARRRVNSALPNEGHTIVDEFSLYELGKQLISCFSLNWLYDCDVMFGKDGKPYILEINPRPSGSFETSICAGVPLLDDLVSLAKGETIPEVTIPYGRVIVPYKTLYKTSL